MKSSYKIGLALAAGLLLVVIVVFAMPEREQAQSSDDDSSTQALAADDGQGDEPSTETPGETRSANNVSGNPRETNNASDDSRATRGPLPPNASAMASAKAPQSPPSSASGEDSRDGQKPERLGGSGDGNLLARVRSQVKTAQAQDARQDTSGANQSAIAGANSDTSLFAGPNANPSSQATDSPTAVPTANEPGANRSATLDESPATSPSDGSNQSAVGATDAEARPGMGQSGSINNPAPEDDQGLNVNKTAASPNDPATSPRTAARTDDSANAKQRSAMYPKTYTVKKGQSMAIIAGKVYGNQKHWVDIAQANPTVDPQRLQVGQRIKMPSRGEIEGDGQRSNVGNGSISDSGPDDAGVGPYTVQEGDTLSRIARQYYGDPDNWYLIFEANRNVLGDDPDTVSQGDKLTIPPAPNRAGEQTGK